MSPQRVDCRVLLIEDDDGNALTTAALLEDCGYVVDVAASLAEAKQRLLDGCYELVLLDNRLSDGHGVNFLPTLRSHLPSARIILVSGESLPQHAQKFDAVFVKGADFTLLLETVRRLRVADCPTDACPALLGTRKANTGLRPVYNDVLPFRSDEARNPQTCQLTYSEPDIESEPAPHK